jgi:hypothetical protein
MGNLMCKKAAQEPRPNTLQATNRKAHHDAIELMIVTDYLLLCLVGTNHQHLMQL